MLEEPPPDCSLLTRCEWPGINLAKLGDGFCNTEACYNSLACSFDSGDCCASECEDAAFVCGTNDYDCQLEFTKSCPEKMLRILRFCIDGEPEDAGNGIEIQISLNDVRNYYPGDGGCGRNDKNDEGFCEVPKNSCLFLDNPLSQPYENFFTLLVGFEEDDNGSNDFSFGDALPGQWYSDDCRPYEVQIYREFQATTTVKSCYNIEGSVGATVPLKGVEVSGEVKGGFESCSTFEKPAESYVWYVEVTSV